MGESSVQLSLFHGSDTQPLLSPSKLAGHTGVESAFSSPVLLPIVERILFVDWNGVLSHDPFWWSILSSARHPYRGDFKGFVSNIFAAPDHVEAWMRGSLESADVLRKAGPPNPPRANGDYVMRRLVDDCRRMPMDQEVLQLVRRLRTAECLAILATDNMDCFYSAALRRSDFGREFDGILCSSEVGVLKREDPDRFFAGPLAAAGVSIDQAVLVDDSEQNCDAFRAAGGSAVLFTDVDSLQAALVGLKLM